MLVVGLTGGAGCGKTTISRMLAEKGAYIIDADQIARGLVEPGKPVQHEIVQRFGGEILSHDGSINRKKLAAIVFCDASKRALLNEIIQPPILKEILRRIEEIRSQDKNAIVVIDAPLLIEMQYQGKMDKVIVVTATEEQQLERLRSRDGTTPSQAQRILSSQLPLEEKLRLADFVIRNEGPLEDAAERVDEIFDILRKIAFRKGEQAVCDN